MLMQVFIMGVCVYYFENRTHYFIIMNPIIIVMNCILANCGNDVSCNCHQIVKTGTYKNNSPSFYLFTKQNNCRTQTRINY